MARYILCRLTEEYGTVATFEPQPVPDWPGNGTFAYFSSKDMREEDGILVIERAIDKLSRRHGVHINEYDAHNGADNARRLTGKNGMPNIRDFTAGVANRCCSVRIPRQVSEDKHGYLEDRRPAANADPYRIISILLKTSSNYLKDCTLMCEKGEVEEPWLGFNQEFFLTTPDGRPLGWPPGGFPAPPGPYYCAIGANKIVARDLMEAFYRCCLYAGVHINGINPGTTPSQWNFQVGPSPGITAADDLWMARYILSRLVEEYGTVATFEPQPVPDWPGNGTFAYFSSKDMREEDGILVIERAIDKLSRRHGVHINEYDAHNGADNARRLTGKNGMPNIRDFTAGVANRCCSVRIPRQVSEDKHGYLEDRRPAANADPYRIISILLKTCIFDE
ncbi:unnamed protein product [Danaus chrysippus]|uniref:glutamine synthetase n=1 Tax=Danaus chrysippus TaxID=151541 RepID=A0A8J2QDI3_9NEOP|nr:unnamed protein product [Danaus chrysippus]